MRKFIFIIFTMSILLLASSFLRSIEIRTVSKSRSELTTKRGYPFIAYETNEIKKTPQTTDTTVAPGLCTGNVSEQAKIDCTDGSKSVSSSTVNHENLIYNFAFWLFVSVVLGVCYRYGSNLKSSKSVY